MEEISRKQIDVTEVRLSDGARGIQIGKGNPIHIGYDESDVQRLLQMLFAPYEEPMRTAETLPEEDLLSLMREGLEVSEERYRNERLGMTLIELVKNGETRLNLEVLPDKETVEIRKVEVSIYDIEEDLKNDFIIEWYTWEVVRTKDLKDKTQVIIHVP
jgi:hypothetical protein